MTTPRPVSVISLGEHGVAEIYDGHTLDEAIGRAVAPFSSGDEPELYVLGDDLSKHPIVVAWIDLDAKARARAKEQEQAAAIDYQIAKLKIARAACDGGRQARFDRAIQALEGETE